MFTKVITIRIRTTVIDVLLMGVPGVVALWFHSAVWAIVCGVFTLISCTLRSSTTVGG